MFDPFCGSGTTLVEAVHGGLDAVGVDVNPLAALLAKVKVTPLAGDLPASGAAVLGTARRKAERGHVAIPPIPKLDHWFKPEIQTALAALAAEIRRVRNADLRDALRVALSSIIVRVSNQESDTRYAAVDKPVTPAHVWSGFERAVRTLSQRIGRDPAPARARIINADLLRLRAAAIGRCIGLVVTSPPYPNAYEYWLYHKYRMYWLGMDPISTREKEIGARPHYFRKRGHTAEDFQRQMDRCFRLLSRVMLPSGYACFVVGRSLIHGVEVDNEALLERAAIPHGFTMAASAERTIATARKAFHPQHGRIVRERIVVFRLTGTP